MIRKEITFIYMDTAEKEMYKPIAKEAKKRGYSVRFTKNRLVKNEIGFYCEHVNYPQNSKLSFIMLHDIIQAYRRWPDIWNEEPWDKYDAGFLPGDQWTDNWIKASHNYYTRPRLGVFKAGWPKADLVADIDREKYKKDFCRKYGMDIEKKTVLYAPAWENNHKQDDFVQAMLKLDVNILIKQSDISDINPEMERCIQKMYELHKDIDRVTILNPKMNIFYAIAVSDLLVSEESSAMAEAEMMGIPAVSVSDWLIPDCIPARYPACDYDFVFMTKKKDLKDTVADILCNYEYCQRKVLEFRDKICVNAGKASAFIMDVVDDCVNEVPVRYQAIQARPVQKLSPGKAIRHWLRCLRIEMAGNYSERFKIIGLVWNEARKMKRLLNRCRMIKYSVLKIRRPADQ